MARFAWCTRPGFKGAISMSSHFHAKAAGRAFAHDHELELPERPRFIPEIVIGPIGEDGVLIAGGGTPDVIAGRSARIILQRVIPLLDGTHSIAEIEDALPEFDEGSVLDCVSLLCSRGCLEDMATGLFDTEEHEDTAAFLGRHNDDTRCNRHRGEALSRIKATAIRVVGPSNIAEVFTQLILGHGFKLAKDDDEKGLTIALSLDRAGPIDWTRGVVPIRLGADAATIGPILQSGISLCPACLERQKPHPVGVPDQILTDLALGLAAQQLLTTVCLTFSTNLNRSGFRYLRKSDGSVTGQEFRPVRQPGCPECMVGGTRLVDDDPRLEAWRYHVKTALPPRSILSRRDHQNHYSASNLALAREVGLLLPGRQKILLPQAVIEADASRTKTGDLTLKALAGLLSFAGGQKAGSDSMPRRIAPSGGNLGSPRIWVFARSVPGLDRCIYLYEPSDHSLHPFGPFHDNELAKALDAHEGLPQAVLIIAGDLARVRRKYRDFALRVVHMDAGVALHYAALASQAQGIDCVEYGDFDLDLMVPFGIPLKPEHPWPIVAIGLGTPSAPVLRCEDRAFRSTAQRNDEEQGAMDRLFPALRVAELTRNSAAPKGENNANVTIDTHLRAAYRRRAVRSFIEVSPSEEMLSAILRAGWVGVHGLRSRGAPPCYITLFLAQNRDAQDLGTGIYHSEPAGSLSRIAAFDAEAAKQCFLQESLANAPSAIIAVADLDMAGDCFGARGYTTQLTTAGAALASAWLAATDLGLGGCFSAGIISQGLKEVAGWDGYTSCPLLALHLGYERPLDDNQRNGGAG
ncbi:nitroreductase family protein [Ruegeria sp. SCP11]|uniref:nitroreductase family protein n=1 Tax=Ruegeria sp. SCP11 TaxID=3141378 RepID=UPI003335A966